VQSPLMIQGSVSPADAGSAESDLHPARRQGGAPTVLVAEDEPDVREMMCMLLRMRGYSVVETGDGQETVDVARRVRPDIILMDLQLPRLNGFAVARFLRQTDALRRVPIIVVSAHDPAKHRNLALAAGCNAYVQKPIDFDRLDALMVSLLS
jgi:two-component system, cell cycle response regulator DivK